MWMLYLILNFAAAKTSPTPTPHAGSVVLWSAELQINSNESPRSDFETQVIANTAIKNCLRESLRRAGDDFSVTIKGSVSEEGAVSGVNVSTYLPSPLDTCLEKAFPSMKLTKGSATTFETTIERVRSPAPRGKAFKIDLNLKPQTGQ